MMNLWYDIKIKFVQRRISVRWSVHSTNNMPNDQTYGPDDDNMEEVFDVKDGDFAAGTIAFGAEGVD